MSEQTEPENVGNADPAPHVSPRGVCRLHMYFSGRVQGVGFRYTVTSLSRGRDVTGWVRNLPDGRVEAISEGTRKEVDSFLEDIQEAMSGYISEVKRAWEPPTEEWPSFSVKF